MLASVPEHRPILIIVQKVDVVGISEPNTVCSGPCKHALCNITAIVDQAVSEHRQDIKEELEEDGIYIRGSEELTTSTHVQGIKQYPRSFGHVGGAVLPPGESAHRRVTEYQARSERGATSSQPAPKPGEKKPPPKPPAQKRKRPTDESLEQTRGPAGASPDEDAMDTGGETTPSDEPERPTRRPRLDDDGDD
jgi:hypothetical protein